MGSNKMISPKAFAFFLILRWTIAFIFLVYGGFKIFDPNFGVNAHYFFASLQDNIFYPHANPYYKFFKTVVVPNAFLFAAIAKYTELTLGAMFFIGFPLKFATYLAFFMHVNYMMLADCNCMLSMLCLNILMIVAEFAVTAIGEK